MKFIATNFIGAWLIQPKVFKDERGFFLESFSQRWFEEQGIAVHFVQDNHSKSVERGVLRGLHFQLPPMAQAKLIRVIRGSVFDVIVDLRQGSATYGTWQGFELSEKELNLLFIPRGFAHGFCTLTSNTEFEYKVDNFYAPEYDSGIIWNDQSLNITWPIASPLLSSKDSLLPTFKEFASPFSI